MNLKKAFLVLFGFAFLLSSAFVAPEDNRTFIHNWLNKYYDKDGQAEVLKQYELKVTNSGFCRYRKVYANGKEEFFSFNLSRFSTMNYYGNTTSGELWLRTKSDDVIVQTRRDKQGDVDSMATYVAIPLKNVDEDKLNELASHFRQMAQNNLVVNR